MDNSLKTKDLYYTTADRASGSTPKPNPKNPDSRSRGTGQGAVRLLRFATALRVTPLPRTIPKSEIAS